MDQPDLIAAAGGQEFGEVLGRFGHGGQQLRPARLVPDCGDPRAWALPDQWRPRESLAGSRPSNSGACGKTRWARNRSFKNETGRAVGELIEGDRESSLCACRPSAWRRQRS